MVEAGERRAVVTGIGMITALGPSRETCWSGFVEGRCGISELTLFEAEGYRSSLVAELPEASIEHGFTPLERRRLARAERAAIVATSEALADSGLLESGVEPTRVGAIFGAGTGDMFRHEVYYKDYLERGLERTRPSQIVNFFPSGPLDVVAERFGLLGWKGCLQSACSSTTLAVGYASDLIRNGSHDAVVCGGSDVLCRLTLSGFNALRLVAPEPCRPFDRSRRGLNIGEAAAILVVEELERAKRRGATIYCELDGYALGCEAHHPTAPDPEGAVVSRLVSRALESSRLEPSAVDHINSHGTGTMHNDRAEAAAVRRVFGERGSTIPLTSVKSMTGHCLGAAGAVEAAVLALTIARGVIPPTIHHEETDPECPVAVVANEAREAEVRCGLSLSLAFGGNDAALVMTRYE